MLKLLRTRIALAVAIVAALVGLYALGGFVIAPKVARHAMLVDIPKTLGLTPSVGDIHINPFLFQVEIRDFALSGKGGEKLLGFGRLFVDFELSSLWHRAYTFGRIEIDSPYVNAVVAPDGVLNLMQLRPKAGASPASAQPKSEAMPALRVGSFKIASGSLSYEDQSRPTHFAARLEPITFELRDFVTGVQGGLFAFSGVSKLGERVEWHGHVSVQPIESDGELSIAGLQARTLWEYLEDRLNFVIPSGRIDAQASYRFALKDAPELAMSVAKVSVTDLAVRPRNSDLDWVSLPQFALSGVSVDLPQRLAHVDSVSLKGLKVAAWLEPGGSLNLLQLAAAPPSSGKGGGAAPAASATTGNAPPAPAAVPAPWRVDLKQFDLEDASISAEDRTLQPAAKVTLAPLSLKIDGASLDLGKPVQVALDTRIDGSGSLAVTGELTPQPAAASLRLKLAGIDLTAVQPYLAERTAIGLRSGRLGGEAQIRYGAKAPGEAPSIEFAGNIDVEHLHAIDEARHDDLIRWDRLDVRGLSYRPDRLEVAEVLVRKPYARIIIEPDATLNVANALKSRVAAPRPDAAVRSGAAAAMPMAIKRVLIKDGLANFTDLSVSPNFSAGIQHLEGGVVGLSSKAGSRASIDLHGAVDAFSPVSIKGEVNPFGPALYTDLAMDFRNIELSIFNPYSGKFAGYNIAKGKLTTELHYKVDGRKLDAQHHVVIDQLEFGDKTASKDAVSLPIKLAVALLKDRHGVIDLELPVTGSLDDPKFRLGPIIWKVFVNILEKAVTAPFALLGSLFGGGPDLQFVDFQPGASALDGAEASKLKDIAKALQDRPQLKIEIPIAAVPELDRPALVSAAFETEIRGAQAQTRGKGAAAAPPAFDQLGPAAKLDLLARLYARDLGSPPKYPPELTAGKDKAGEIPAKIDFLTSALREHASVGDDQLKALAEQRALAVQQALLTDTQVDPARVFLVANNKASAKDGVVRFELSLR